MASKDARRATNEKDIEIIEENREERDYKVGLIRST